MNTRNIRYLAAIVALNFCYLLFGKTEIHAQNEYVVFDVPQNYSFLRDDENYITNPQLLDGFFEKLFQLRTGNSTYQKTVSILHIGDSHIQADFMTGAIRFDIQRDFGNAGRGLIVPCRVARSNESYTFKSSTNVRWDVKRCVFPDNPLPIGIGGITFKTDSVSAFIKLKTYNYPGIDYSFNRLTIFHDKSPSAFDIAVTDTSTLALGYISSLKPGKFPFTSTLDLPAPINEVILQHIQTSVFQDHSMIYGLYAENGKPGVFYNAVGVNGAEYNHYTKASNFAEQSAAIAPDLIVISLGTNEAQETDLKAMTFHQEIDSLVSKMQAVHPGVPIILTTPADSYYRRKYKNPRLPMIAKEIVDYAEQHQIACWNMYAVTGGYGSCTSWRGNRMMAYDGIHFTRGGYELQGNLFYQALANQYNTYVVHRSK